MNRATPDYYVLDEMRRCIALHLQKALKECEILSRDLHHLNPITVVAQISQFFDPADETSIQDCFSDAFWDAKKSLDEDGFNEPNKPKCLPSGLPLK
jgi:hypothetical protein